MRVATPRLAPELIPKTSGPAKGFRKIVCICKPLTPKATPANTAANALGKRKSRIITFHSGCEASPVIRIFKTSLNEILTEPRKTSSRNSTIKRKDKIKKILLPDNPQFFLNVTYFNFSSFSSDVTLFSKSFRILLK